MDEWPGPGRAARGVKKEQVHGGREAARRCADGRALRQGEGMTRLWSPAELSSLGGRTGKMARRGRETEVQEGAGFD